MKFCPHCGGDLAAFLSASSNTAPKMNATMMAKYDQIKVWRALIERAEATRSEPPEIAALAFDVSRQIKELSSLIKPDGTLPVIVHLVFDQKIVPDGGALYMAAMSNGKAGPQDLNYFAARGYLIEEGRVRVSDDVPVGPAFGALDYWGGEKQHRRWHMAKPITLNASRTGDPFFMDDNMLAFGVTWKDLAKIDEAFIQLFEYMATGVRGSNPVARPVMAEVCPLR